MKRTKNLIIVTAVLAALIGVFFLVKTFVKDPDAVPEQTDPETYVLSEISPEQLQSVHLVIRDETDSSAVTVRDLRFTVNSSASGWVWDGDENVPISNDAFVNIVSELQDASSTVRMEDVTDEKLAEYGLTDPYILAEFGLSDGTTAVYHIGSRNSFTSDYYFRNASDPATVYLLNSYAADTLNITVKDALQWDTLPAPTESALTSLTLEGPAHRYVYTYYPTGKDSDYTGLLHWYLSVDGGAEFAGSELLAADLSDVLTSLRFADCVHYTGDVPAEYGLSSSAVKMTFAYKEVTKVTDSETGKETEVSTPASLVLTLGAQDAEGLYYCKTEDSQLIYTLSGSDVFARAQAEEPAALRQKALLSYDIDRIDAMKFTASGAVLDVAVTHGTDGVTYTDASGIAFDLTRFTALTDKLGAMTAASDTAYVEPVSSAGTDLLFRAEFTYNHGDVASSALEIREYSGAYCRVTFMDRDGQLVTREDALALVDTFLAYFDGKNT